MENNRAVSETFRPTPWVGNLQEETPELHGNLEPGSPHLGEVPQGAGTADMTQAFSAPLTASDGVLGQPG